MEERAETRSIIKQHPEKSQKKKRLSFATEDRPAAWSQDPGSPVLAGGANVTPTNKGLRDRFRGDSGSPSNPSYPDELQFETSDSSALQNLTQLDGSVTVNPVSKNIRSTTAGFCYVPSKRKNRRYKDSMPVVPMVDNNRNIFVTALKNSISMTAKVLIIGNKCEGEKLKNKLLSLQTTQKNDYSLKWSLELNIILIDSPSPDDIVDTNYFIFMPNLNTLESLRVLTAQIKTVESGGVMLNVHGILLCLSSAQGVHRNVITWDKLNEFLDKHQICHIHWTKPDKDHYQKLLWNIHESMGYHSGVSRLTKSVLMRHNKYTVEYITE